MMWSASNCSLLIAILYTFAHLLVWYPNPNPDHLVFFQLGYISKCFHSFQHLATISRMKHRLSKIYSNIASLSPRYILCIYIYIYPFYVYPKFANPELYQVMDWLYPSPVLEGPNCGIETGATQEAIIQSSPFISLPSTLFFKDHTGQNKKRFTKLQALVNHL